MAQNKKDISEESFVIFDREIKEQFNVISNHYSKNTAQTNFDDFKKLLYFSLFLGSQSRYMYEELVPKEFSLSKEFSVILKLWYQYLTDQKYLDLTLRQDPHYSLLTTLKQLPLELCSLNSYSKISFNWKIPRDFFDFFMHVLVTITSTYKDYCKYKKHCETSIFSVKKFFEPLLPQYADFCETHLEKNYLYALDDFYQDFQVTILSAEQRACLYNYVQKFTDILMCQEGKRSSTISLYVKQLLGLYSKRLHEELSKNNNNYFLLYPHYEPYFFFQFEKNSMQIFLDCMTIEQTNVIEQLRNLSRISNENFSLLEKLEEDIFQQIDHRMNIHKLHLHCLYANCTQRDTENFLSVSAEAAFDHYTAFCTQIDTYASAFKKSLTAFKKSKHRELCYPKRAKDINTLTIAGLNARLNTEFKNAETTFNKSISVKTTNLSPIAQALNEGFLRKFADWNLPLNRENFILIIKRFLIDLEIKKNSDSFLESKEITSILDRTKYNSNYNFLLCTHDIFLALRAIEHISQ